MIFHSEMKFQQHINAEIKKANTMAGFIRRTFSFLDGNLFNPIMYGLFWYGMEFGMEGIFASAHFLKIAL